MPTNVSPKAVSRPQCIVGQLVTRVPSSWSSRIFRDPHHPAANTRTNDPCEFSSVQFSIWPTPKIHIEYDRNLATNDTVTSISRYSHCHCATINVIKPVKLLTHVQSLIGWNENCCLIWQYNRMLMMMKVNSYSPCNSYQHNEFTFIIISCVLFIKSKAKRSQNSI